MGTQDANYTSGTTDAADTRVGTPCKMCRERVKDWSGDDPKCGFPNGGEFDAGNWNCATVNALRDLAESTRDGVLRSYGDDQTHVMINLDDDALELPSWDAAPASALPPLSLWLTWYKRRGRTQALWLLGEEDAPRRPTEADVLAILTHYARAAKAVTKVHAVVLDDDTPF